jgi:NADH-quinone oxidoreductase subunit A
MSDMLAYHPFAPVFVLFVIVAVMTAGILALTHLVGPKRPGMRKEYPYESGMPVVGDARQRFNVRFYLVAVFFLMFDVEVLFLWPWAPLFHETAAAKPSPIAAQMIAAGHGREFLLVVMGLFVVILLLGYLYDWRKGVFEWN